jgi:galactokinase
VSSARFGLSGPEFEVLAPGRVNLIGDHIDYLGYEVLPVALAQCVRIACRVRLDGRVRISSALHNEDVSLEPGASIPPASPGHWSNYVRAAIQALHTPDRHSGFDAIISSDLPPAAGLSSSSALVVASAIAYLHANGESFDRLELAERMARAERYVGTEGGGMDQAVCLLAEAGTAARISFSPLRVTHVPIPAGWQFLVADSLERAEKSSSARAAYNARAHEARRAIENVMVAGSIDVKAPERTGDVLAAGERLLGEPMLRRLRHVVSEAGRVRRAVDALRDDDPLLFGRIMNESHASLQHDFEVSTKALDRLCEILVRAGAHGARLTGAGLGGSVVALCSRDSAIPLIAAVDHEYYALRGVVPTARERFLVEPSAGATINE